MARVVITVSVSPETHRYIESVVQRAGEKVGRGVVVDTAIAALIEKEKSAKKADKRAS